MILYILPGQRVKFRNEIDQFFKLRKKVFCDQYGWVEPRPDGREVDRYDSLYNVYILYLDPDTGVVAGGARLMPTMGDTLMHSVWSDMLPKPDAYRAKDIWEVTRFCVDDSSDSSRKGNFVNRATLALSLAVMDFGSANNINQVIGVCEKKFFDMSGAYGAHAEIISTRIDENGTEISCGLWATNNEKGTLGWARGFIGGVEPALIKDVA